MVTKNMPPKELWLVDDGNKVRYYRTLIQLKQSALSYLFKANVWHCDFEDIYPHWVLLTSQQKSNLVNGVIYWLTE
jgi:hypothetical protein